MALSMVSESNSLNRTIYRISRNPAQAPAIAGRLPLFQNHSSGPDGASYLNLASSIGSRCNWLSCFASAAISRQRQLDKLVLRVNSRHSPGEILVEVWADRIRQTVGACPRHTVRCGCEM